MADGTLIPFLAPFFGALSQEAGHPATLLPVEAPSLGALSLDAQRPAILMTDVAPYTMHGSGGGPGAVEYFQMRGYRYMHVPAPDFETWVAVGAPNASNPSGEPIQDVVIQTNWME